MPLVSWRHAARLSANRSADEPTSEGCEMKLTLTTIAMIAVFATLARPNVHKQTS